MAGLSKLLALTSLELIGCAAVPSSLNEVTQLRELQVSTAEPLAGLHTAISSLTGLSSLWLAGDFGYVLPVLPALSHLKRLGISPAVPGAAAAGGNQVAGGAAQQLPVLPAGAYISSLEELALSWPLLVNSLAVLKQALHLRYVKLRGMPDPTTTPKEVWDAAFAWLAHHPPLAALAFRLKEETDGLLPYSLFDAMMILKERRPGLKVRRGAKDAGLP